MSDETTCALSADGVELRRARVDDCPCDEDDVTSKPAPVERSSSCVLRQVDAPDCIRYDTFYKALQFVYCGEVDPAAPVPNSPDTAPQVRVALFPYIRMQLDWHRRKGSTFSFRNQEYP